MNDLAIVLRSLRVRGVSTAITLLSVALGVALLLVLLTMRDSGKAAFERGSGDMHLLVTAEQSPLVSVLNSIFYAGAPRRAMTLEKFEQVRASAPFAYAVPTAVGDSYAGYPVVATTRGFFEQFKPAPDGAWAVAEGRLFEREWEAVLGASVASRLGLSVGDTIALTHGYNPRAVRPGTRPSDAAHDHHEVDHAHEEHADDAEGMDQLGHVHTDHPYTIVGILAPSITPHDRAIFTSLESTWLSHAEDARSRGGPLVRGLTPADLTPAEKLVTAAYLRLVTRPGSDAPANLPQVFDQLRRDGSITVAQPRQEIARLFTIVDQTNRLFLAIATLVMISSGLGIALALFNSMDMRRRQVAVLRVLGASRGRVFNLVLTECAMLGLAGGALGVVLAYAGAHAAGGILRERLGIIITPTPDAGVVVFVLAATVVLACLSGLAPAVLTYRTSVSRSLRRSV